jgi:hypothetical protein
MKAAAAPVGAPWLWTLAFGHHKDRTPTHGYAATREAAMAAFAKSAAGVGIWSSSKCGSPRRLLRRNVREHKMPNSNTIIPITDEQAKLGQKALEVLQGVGGFLREILGTVPEDLVGYLGGDLLKVRRAENLVRIVEEARERLTARGMNTTEPPSISLLLPILVASADESRDELT